MVASVASPGKTLTHIRLCSKRNWSGLILDGAIFRLVILCIKFNELSFAKDEKNHHLGVWKLIINMSRNPALSLYVAVQAWFAIIILLRKCGIESNWETNSPCAVIIKCLSMHFAKKLPCFHSTNGSAILFYTKSFWETRRGTASCCHWRNENTIFIC